MYLSFLKQKKKKYKSSIFGKQVEVASYFSLNKRDHIKVGLMCQSFKHSLSISLTWLTRYDKALPVKTTWWVTSIPTANMLAPLVKTISAASGSPKIFASAAGLTFPFTEKAPPIITISPTILVKLESNWTANAIFVRGAKATTVTSPGCRLACSMRNSAADCSNGFPFGTVVENSGFRVHPHHEQSQRCAVLYLAWLWHVILQPLEYRSSLPATSNDTGISINDDLLGCRHYLAYLQ